MRAESMLRALPALMLIFAPCALADEGFVKAPDGVSIHYTEAGSGGTSIVFVHGWSCDSSYWSAQINYFAERYRVVAIDLAGHGDSEAGREEWTMEAFGADVAAMLEALDIKRAILVGHSMGGRAIAEAAVRAPDRVIALVAADAYNDISRGLPEETIESFLKPLREDFAAETRRFVSQYMFAPGTDQAFIDRIAGDMASEPAEVGVGAMDALLHHDIAAVLKAASKPVYCINSDRSPTNNAALEAAAPHFELKIMKGAGHFIMMERPQEFNALLDDVIASATSR